MEKLDILAKTENLDTVIDFVNEHLEGVECPMKIQMQIDVAVEEIFVNIANYAYGTGEGPATVRINVDNQNKIVDITLSAQERQIGGLGIFMVKKSMDDVTYEYRDGHNILTLKKGLKG